SNNKSKLLVGIQKINGEEIFRHSFFYAVENKIQAVQSIGNRILMTYIGDVDLIVKCNLTSEEHTADLITQCIHACFFFCRNLYNVLESLIFDILRRYH